ncbi:hypothetical protein SS50377_22518 [Spironucleus salmonicida]|uniref:Uncharacterized protein n=1 Tax=Spironucleus salmonicida TaxID=348837 RepID=A0A9P8LVM9_9EUKA|nr:hypothetical protein SS50377_22518 [Spironucleus salmonicida]
MHTAYTKQFALAYNIDAHQIRLTQITAQDAISAQNFRSINGK